MWFAGLALSAACRAGTWRASRSVCLVFALIAGSQAWAQSASDLEAARRQSEAVQRQQQEQLRRDQEAAQPPAKGPGGIDTRKLLPKLDASKTETKCRGISSIAINGAPNLSDSVRQKISKAYEGRCLGTSEIVEILGEITRDYVLRGYVSTRAYLPTQDLSGGQLEFLVVEGKIEKLRVEGGPQRGISPGNTFPAKPGDLLNLRDLEQGIDQVNRLTSNKATLDIQPGSAPGLSDVLIRNEPGPFYHLMSSADNQGSAATGKHQLGTTLSLDSVLGLTEFISFTHRVSIPNTAQQHAVSNSLLLGVPFGYTTLNFNASRSRYASTVKAPSGRDLATSGDSGSHTLALDRVVHRDQTQRVTVTGAFTNKKTRNFLEGQLLGVSSRTLSVLDLDGGVTTRLGQGALSMTLGWAQGLTAAGALRDIDGLPDSAPRAQFKKIKYTASYSLPWRWLDSDWTLSSQVTGQVALTTLFGSEQVSIGGIYSVRGHEKNALSGDSGYFLRNELSVRAPVSLAATQLPLRLFVGLDAGAVRNRAPDVPQGSLAGSAFGASLGWKAVSAELFGTCPLAVPSAMERESCQTWFRLNVSI